MNKKTLLRIALIVFVALTPTLTPLPTLAQPSKKVTANPRSKAIHTIRTIFNNYIHQEENVETPDNGNAMHKALQSLSGTLTENELYLLVDVWMYYDPTDFPTKGLITPILERNKPNSLAAANRRLKDKKKWESKDTAPYSDLIDLQKYLSK